jgi:hypothetical protein
MNRHPIGKFSRIVDTTAHLTNRLPPDGVVQRCQIQVAVGSVNGGSQTGTGQIFPDAAERDRVVQAVAPVGNNLPPNIADLLDPGS